MTDESQHIYEELALSYVRGIIPALSGESNRAKILAQGRESGLKLHRFKRTMELPRVRAVLGILKGLAPRSLLDIGSGRGVFLWPLLDTFPDLAVMAVEQDERRFSHLDAVRRGGIERLRPLHADATDLPFDANQFDVVTVLEVLEHQTNPAPLAKEVVRLADGFVVVSVPSKPDDNPEHVQLFDKKSLSALLLDAGAENVRISYVLNHIIACAKVASS